MYPVVRETLRGLKRDRQLAMVMIGALAIVVGNWLLTDVLWREQQHPLVRDAASLYVVAIHRDARYDLSGEEAEKTAVLLQTLLPPRDVEGVTRHPAIARPVVTAAASLAVAPQDGAIEQVATRFASAGLFEMFGLAFRWGSAFRDGADELVVSDELNHRWFAGENSVGRTVRIGARTMRVAGVLDFERWPRQFDTRLPKAEGLFLSIEAFQALRPWPDPVLPTANASTFFTNPNEAEDLWARVFVTVTPEGRRDYESFVQSYAASQSRRTPRVVSARLVPWAEWAAVMSGAEGIYDVVYVMGILLLGAGVFNLVRLSMVRAGSRAAELGIARALGENRRTMMLRQLLEAAVIGLCAGVIGLILLAIAIPAFNAAIPPRPMAFFLDGQAVVSAFLVGPAAAMLAALYPAWRFGRMTPAGLLRRQ